MSSSRPHGLTAEDLSEALDKAFPVFKGEVALARIEEQLAALSRLVEHQSEKLDAVEAELRQFRSLRDKGLGWLAGVAIAGGVIGAAIKGLWLTIFGGAG